MSEFFKKHDLVRVEGISDASFFCAENSNHFECGKTMVNGLGHIDTELLSPIKRISDNCDSDKINNEVFLSGEESIQNIIRQSLTLSVRSFDIKDGDLRKLYNLLKALDKIGWE